MQIMKNIILGIYDSNLTSTLKIFQRCDYDPRVGRITVTIIEDGVPDDGDARSLIANTLSPNDKRTIQEGGRALVVNGHHRYEPIVELPKDNHPIFGFYRDPFPVHLTLRSDGRSLFKMEILKQQQNCWTTLLQQFYLVLSSCKTSATWLRMQGNWMISTRCLFRRLRLCILTRI